MKSFKRLLKKLLYKLSGAALVLERQSQLIEKTNAIHQLQVECLNAQRFNDTIRESKWLRYQSFSAGGWAADYGLLYTLYRALEAVQPKNILEFGLGQSSKMIHQYAGYFSANAYTFEHDENWITFFEKNKLGDYPINIISSKLKTISYKGYETLTYADFQANIPDRKFNFVLVDGPFGSSHYSRSQLLLMIDHLDLSHFCVIIDDYERLGEKETIVDFVSQLKERGIAFCEREYISSKSHYLICSDDLKFLISM